MSPWQVFILLVAGTITGLIGWVIGRRAGKGTEGFLCGFFLSLIGVAIIAVSAAADKGGREEEQVKKAAAQLRIQQEAQRRVSQDQHPAAGQYPPSPGQWPGEQP